jgi:hypothetical protein
MKVEISDVEIASIYMIDHDRTLVQDLDAAKVIRKPWKTVEIELTTGQRYSGEFVSGGASWAGSSYMSLNITMMTNDGLTTIIGRLYS